MKLFYRKTGTGFPLIILHGLYGSSDNWMTIAKNLAENYTVISPDLRNHGQSPHNDEMDINTMALDIIELLQELEIDKCILMGHSMGGMLALHLAFSFPERFEKLIIVDIAPRSYLHVYSKHLEFHNYLLNVLKSINLENITSRKEVEYLLREKIPFSNIILFLLKNLKRKNEGGYAWKLNIDSIHRNLYRIMEGVQKEDYSEDTVFTKPVLFIKGEKSDYLNEEDIPEIKKLFTNFYFEIIPNADHWVHAEKPEKFLEAIRKFI